MDHANQALRVDYAAIDGEHKDFFSLVEVYFQDHLKDPTEEKIKAVFTQLRDYCLGHFSSEETSMEKFSFPELKEHQGQHKDLFLKLMILEKQAAGNPEDCCEQVIAFIKEEVIPHVEEEDFKYTLFLRSFAKNVIVDDNQTAYFCDNYRLSPLCVYNNLNSKQYLKMGQKKAKEICTACNKDYQYKDILVQFMSYCALQRKKCWFKESKINLNCSTDSLKKLLEHCCTCASAT